MFPPAVVVDDVDEPRTEQFVTVLFCAPLMKRIVLVLAVAEAVVLNRQGIAAAVESVDGDVVGAVQIDQRTSCDDCAGNGARNTARRMD